jgi:hypothetical protein
MARKPVKTPGRPAKKSTKAVRFSAADEARIAQLARGYAQGGPVEEKDKLTVPTVFNEPQDKEVRAMMKAAPAAAQQAVSSMTGPRVRVDVPPVGDVIPPWPRPAPTPNFGQSPHHRDVPFIAGALNEFGQNVANTAAQGYDAAREGASSAADYVKSYLRHDPRSGGDFGAPSGPRLSDLPPAHSPDRSFVGDAIARAQNGVDPQGLGSDRFSQGVESAVQAVQGFVDPYLQRARDYRQNFQQAANRWQDDTRNAITAVEKQRQAPAPATGASQPSNGMLAKRGQAARRPFQNAPGNSNPNPAAGGNALSVIPSAQAADAPTGTYWYPPRLPATDAAPQQNPASPSEALPQGWSKGTDKAGVTHYLDDKGNYLEGKGAKGGGAFSVLSGPGAASYAPEQWNALSNDERIAANVKAYQTAGQAENDMKAMRAWRMLKPSERGNMPSSVWAAMNRGATPQETAINVARARIMDAGLPPEQQAVALSKLESIQNQLMQSDIEGRKVDVLGRQTDNQGRYWEGRNAIDQQNARTDEAFKQGSLEQVRRKTDAELARGEILPAREPDADLMNALPEVERTNYLQSVKDQNAARARAALLWEQAKVKNPGAPTLGLKRWIAENYPAELASVLPWIAPSYAAGGPVQAPIYGGTPAVSQVDPVVQAYRDYMVKAQQTGVPVVPFQQFAQLKSMTMQAPPQAQPGALGLAGGGSVPVAGKMVVDTNPQAGVDSIPATIDGKAPAALNSGEFVIPTDVVNYYGTKFLNGLLERARTAGDKNAQSAR